MADVKTTTGTRGVYRADVEASLPYLVCDADHHFYEPDDSMTRHLERKYRDRMYGQRPISRSSDDDDHKSRTIGVHTVPEGGFGGVDPDELPEMSLGGDIPMPGAMLNRLNPMRDLTSDEREELAAHLQQMQPAFLRREERLQLMDEQHVEAAVIHSIGGAGDPAFLAGDLEAGYAIARAFNRWIQDDWGFSYKNRIFVPAAVPLADVEQAVAELDRVLGEGAALVNLPTGPSYGRSPFDPYFDPYWARVQEAGTPVVIHLGGGRYQRYGADWSEDPDADYAQFNGFQWVTYWGDRPVMDTVTAMIFHNLFGRFPEIKVLIAEHGTVWLPYLLRKMDHAFLLGRQTKWGDRLTERPSELFQRHVLIAPFPEENVARTLEIVRPECLVFGSDFPHSEGLPDPVQYVTQLKDLPDSTVKLLMRDNLAGLLGLATG
jgi:predicted TIM-barrel fold metal-dependent hydrolase